MSFFGSPGRMQGRADIKEENYELDGAYLSSYLSENKSLRDKIKKLNNEIVLQKEENIKIRNELEQRQDEVKQYDITVAELNSQIVELRKINKSLVEEANKRIIKLNTELQLTRDDNEALKYKIMQYQNANKDFSMENMNIRSKLDDSNMQIKRLNDQLSRSSITIKTVAERESLANQQVVEMQGKLNHYIDKCAKLQAQLAMNQRKLNEQGTVVDSLQYKISSLEEVSRRIKSLNSVIQEKDDIIQNLQDAIVRSESKCQTLTDALNHAQEKVDQQSYHESEIKTLRGEHALLVKRAEDAEECARRYEKELLEKSGQFTETIVKQNATISRLTSKLNETQLKFRDQIIGKDSIAADAENAKREADKFGRQYNEMMKKCQTITMKVNDLSSSFNSSPKRVSDLQPVLPSMTSRSTMQSTMRYNSLESFNDEQDTDDQMKRDLLSTNTDSSSA